ncbi:MAG: carbon-nitrogen hydrolase family protein [Bacillota bacterium]|nr:carbon-nitrogen hydrolase family protein [Bacillota bacterium]
MRLALCQMKVGMSKKENVEKACSMIREAVSNGADIAALPEMFSCPYSNSYFREYAEYGDGETVKTLSALARENGIYIVGGSIPELDGDKVYNTSFIFGKKGELIGRHRKVHLFDIDVEGGIRFKESDTLSPGNSITVVETEFCRIGVAICYDVRFPELSRLMALEGAELIILPAAFNMTTGPVHWDLSMRMRALDNQVYFAAVSPARDMNGVYQAYGNSCVASPWGEFAAHIDENEGILYCDIDLDRIKKVRNELPLLKHRREDMYKLELLK